METPDILIPALGKLQKCQTGLDVLYLIEMLPDELLPALAWAASRKRSYAPFVVATLVKACGFAQMQRSLGLKRARDLFALTGVPIH